MVLVFDLDDTLYEELTFIKSGFNAASDYLSKTYGIPSTYKEMLAILDTAGRGQIFNILLKQYNIYSMRNVRKCISVYRCHKPNISLNESAKQCLQRFSSFHKYIITDGNKLVQTNKINALNIRPLFTGIYITRNYGIDKEKPSPYCFMKIRDREKVPPKDIVYIGDNSYKDFVGIKKLGFRTIRIRQGFYKDVLLSKEYDAEYTLSSLDELDKALLLSMGNR
jgi:putative hydrolase of the HAD superfamily